MNRTSKNTKGVKSFFILILGACLIVHYLYCSSNAFAQERNSNNSVDSSLIDEFINSKGYKDTILFDSLNIKQFWIDDSIFCQNNLINISLRKKQSIFSSVPLKIQLANIDESMSCRITVVSNTKNTSFHVTNSNSKKITESTSEMFLNYNVLTGEINLDETPDNSFNLIFNSIDSDSISIQKIILSFSKNIDSFFKSSPGTFTVSGDSIFGIDTTDIKIDGNSFSVTGIVSKIQSNNKIIVRDNVLSCSLKIKNIGTTPTHVYMGYAPYTKAGKRINCRSNPFGATNNVFKVISSSPNSNILLIDGCPEWKRGCVVAINAKEDLSDFPNNSFVGGSIVDVKIINDNQAEIYLSKPIDKILEKGTQARIQSPDGNTYIYTSDLVLQPGEETELTSTIKKDDQFLLYSPEAFCRGTYYVQPVVISYSINRKDENTILISDYIVKY